MKNYLRAIRTSTLVPLEMSNNKCVKSSTFLFYKTILSISTYVRGSPFGLVVVFHKIGLNSCIKFKVMLHIEVSKSGYILKCTIHNFFLKCTIHKIEK